MIHNIADFIKRVSINAVKIQKVKDPSKFDLEYFVTYGMLDIIVRKEDVSKEFYQYLLDNYSKGVYLAEIPVPKFDSYLYVEFTINRDGDLYISWA